MKRFETQWWTAALLLVAVATPVAADRLVTVEGAVLETDGPWTVKGRQVVFTDPHGQLRSLRLDDVDLAASESATAKAAAPAEAPAPAADATPKRPVAVITDADVPRGVRRPPATLESAEDGAEDPEAAEDAEEVVSQVHLAVASWDVGHQDGVDGAILTGVVENRGELLVTNPSLTVRALDEDGQVVVEVRAFLSEGVIGAGQAASFRAPLTVDTWDYATLEFVTAGNAVEFAPAVSSTGEGSS